MQSAEKIKWGIILLAIPVFKHRACFLNKTCYIQTTVHRTVITSYNIWLGKINILWFLCFMKNRKKRW
jgi:hypothetical protein